MAGAGVGAGAGAVIEPNRTRLGVWCGMVWIERNDLRMGAAATGPNNACVRVCGMAWCSGAGGAGGVGGASCRVVVALVVMVVLVLALILVLALAVVALAVAGRLVLSQARTTA